MRSHTLEIFPRHLQPCKPSFEKAPSTTHTHALTMRSHTLAIFLRHPQPCKPSFKKAPSTTHTRSHHALTHSGNLPQAPPTVQALTLQRISEWATRHSTALAAADAWPDSPPSISPVGFVQDPSNSASAAAPPPSSPTAAATATALAAMSSMVQGVQSVLCQRMAACLSPSSLPHHQPATATTTTLHHHHQQQAQQQQQQTQTQTKQQQQQMQTQTQHTQQNHGTCTAAQPQQGGLGCIAAAASTASLQHAHLRQALGPEAFLLALLTCMHHTLALSSALQQQHHRFQKQQQQQQPHQQSRQQQPQQQQYHQQQRQQEQHPQQYQKNQQWQSESRSATNSSCSSDVGVRRAMASVLLAAVHATPAMCVLHTGGNTCQDQQQQQQQQQQPQPQMLPRMAWLRLCMQIVSWFGQLLLEGSPQQSLLLLHTITETAVVHSQQPICTTTGSDTTNSSRSDREGGFRTCSCPLCHALLPNTSSPQQAPVFLAASAWAEQHLQQQHQEHDRTVPSVVLALMQVCVCVCFV